MSAGTWYVKTGRTAVNWGTDVSGGVAQVDITKLVVGTVNEQRFLFARAGQAVTADQVAAAQAETSGGSVPAALLPGSPVAPGGVGSVNTIYGASAAPGASVSANTDYDSAASLTITTTKTNTRWLIEVDADIKWIQGTSGIPVDCAPMVKVDGGYFACSGGVGAGAATNVGFEMVELPVRGRAVVTLATAASHTVLAAVHNGSGGAVTVKAVTITATLLS